MLRRAGVSPFRGSRGERGEENVGKKAKGERRKVKGERKDHEDGVETERNRAPAVPPLWGLGGAGRGKR